MYRFCLSLVYGFSALACIVHFVRGMVLCSDVVCGCAGRVCESNVRAAHVCVHRSAEPLEYSAALTVMSGAADSCWSTQRIDVHAERSPTKSRCELRRLYVAWRAVYRVVVLIDVQPL